jgi:hypothetical protein
MRGFWFLVLAATTSPAVATAQSSPARSASVAASQRPAPPAQPPAPSSGWAQRPFALDANMGVATPLGNLGVSLEYAPLAWLSLSAGAGTNLEGPQLAAMLRVRATPNRPSSLFAGAGYSRGAHAQSLATRYGTLSLAQAFVDAQGESGPKTPSRHWQRADWANVELGGEMRPANGFDARGFFGVAFLLNPSANRVEGRDTSHVNAPLPLDVVPLVFYVGTAVGFSL